MSAETQAIRIPEKIMRQIRSDSQAALLRARVCPNSNEAVQLSCIDYRRETETEFGSQLWYFDAQTIDERNRRAPVFGVLEYSIQYGLHILADDGVFDSLAQRERFHSVYRRGHLAPTLWHPANWWLALAVLCVTAVVLFLSLPLFFAA